MGPWFDTIFSGGSYRVKDREKALLYRTVCAEGPLSRLQLAKELGLRPTTVSKAVQELVDDRFVIEAGLREPRRAGRPEYLLTHCPGRLFGIAL